MSQPVKNEHNEATQNTDIAVGKMDHIEGAEKEAETDGDQGVITPQEQAVDDLLDKFQGSVPLVGWELFSFEKPALLDAVRYRWPCLEKILGVLEYWSVGVLV